MYINTYWQEVAQHQIPQSVINKINNINSQTGWFISAEIVGLYYAEALASAHENRPPSYQYEYKEVQMDLFNNQAGRTIGQIVESDPDYFNMLQMVINQLNNGELRYLSNLLGGANSGQATAQSNLIPTNQ